MKQTINTYLENVVSLAVAAKHVGKLTKQRPNVRMLQRWARRGVAGVRLPVIRIGSELYTSTEKIDWFFHASREAQLERSSTAIVTGIKEANNSVQLEQVANQLIGN